MPWYRDPALWAKKAIINLRHHGQVQLRPLHPGLRGLDLEAQEL